MNFCFFYISAPCPCLQPLTGMYSSSSLHALATSTTLLKATRQQRSQGVEVGWALDTGSLRDRSPPGGSSLQGQSSGEDLLGSLQKPDIQTQSAADKRIFQAV